MRTWEGCGDSFEPNRMGRPRRFCRLCRPVTDADHEAARERLWAVVEERNRVNRERLRAGERAMRARIRGRRSPLREAELVGNLGDGQKVRRCVCVSHAHTMPTDREDAPAPD